MKKHDTWAVAAAIMLRDGNMCQHYVTLADEVRRSELTTLGEKGETPSQSMGVILRTTKIDGEPVFASAGEGLYDLAAPERIKHYGEVQAAQQSMEEAWTAESEIAQLSSQVRWFHDQNEQLSAQVKALSEALRAIHALSEVGDGGILTDRQDAAEE